MNADSTAPLRSWLFTPASHVRRVEQAIAGAAHAVIIDLEDAVPAGEKEGARALLANVLQQTRRENLFVRINALDTEFAFDDVTIVANGSVRGLILPKAERPRDIEVLDWLLTQVERRSDIVPGTLEIVPLLETALAFEALPGICRASPRVRRLAFGAADFTLDMGLSWSDDEHELLPWRAAMVLASRAAGIDAPIDTPWLNLADSAGMAASSGRARMHGFAGKLCIHPSQIVAIHAAYVPTDAAVEQARRHLVAFEAAGSTAIKVDGRMVDEPVAQAARRVLDEAAALNPAQAC